MDFGDKLLSLLEEKEISQKEFAVKLNIAPTTLNGYIKNKRQPDFELVKTIAGALDVSIDFLFDYDGKAPALTADELSLILKLRSLSDDQREIVRDLINLSANKNTKRK